MSKIINIYILLLIIIISPNVKNTVLKYYNIVQFGNSCTLSRDRINEYNSCNIFCAEDFINRTNFEELYIEKYSKFFRNLPNANEFCGQEMYTLNTITNSFSIINKSIKDIQNSNINYCNYEIHNTKYFNNQLDIANLIIKFNTNNSEKNNLKLIFDIILQNSYLNSSKLETINEMDLIKEHYKIGLNHYDKIIILLNFQIDNKNNSDIDESIEIKIDTNNSNNKKNSLRNIILIVIFSILGISVMIVINFICYRRKEIQDIQIQNEIIKQEELKKKQREEKINKLLISKEFNENYITNNCTECTICLEKFIDKCLICITPCKHIFHYECLNNFVEAIKGKKKPIIKCPLCNYDFLEENEGKKLNEINNISNHINNNEINNIEININENNNIENNINENNNNQINNNEINTNENNVQQNNFMIYSQTINVINSNRSTTSEENLKKNNI